MSWSPCQSRECSRRCLRLGLGSALCLWLGCWPAGPCWVLTRPLWASVGPTHSFTIPPEVLGPHWCLRLHPPLGELEVVAVPMQLWVSDSRSMSPKGRSEDDSYDDEMLSAIEGLSSTR